MMSGISWYIMRISNCHWPSSGTTTITSSQAPRTLEHSLATSRCHWCCTGNRESGHSLRRWDERSVPTNHCFKASQAVFVCWYSADQAKDFPRKTRQDVKGPPPHAATNCTLVMSRSTSPRTRTMEAASTDSLKTLSSFSLRVTWLEI